MLYLNEGSKLSPINLCLIEPIQNVVFKYKGVLSSTALAFKIEPIQNVVFKSILF